MREAGKANAGRRRTERARDYPHSFRISAGLAIAACLVLVGAMLWLFLTPAKVATLAMADPGVVIERGKFELEAEAGMAIRVGDRVVKPDEGRAMFAYNNEPTEVTVHSGTRVGLDIVRESKQLTLERGAFVANVARQDPGRPLGLVTPQAEAIVVGTRFKLSTADTSTRLEVFEGAVRIMQSLEGPSMQVPAGHFVNVEPGRPVSLLPLPKSTGGVQLEHWRTDGPGATNELTLNELMFSGVGVAPGGSRVRGYLHPPLSGAYLFHAMHGHLASSQQKTKL
jgi:ferric-dicitrate binding protein FerR (iron transport regulator)